MVKFDLIGELLVCCYKKKSECKKYIHTLIAFIKRKKKKKKRKIYFELLLNTTDDLHMHLYMKISKIDILTQLKKINKRKFTFKNLQL